VVTKAEASKNQYPRADSALAVNVAFCGRSLATLGLFKETRALPGRGTFKLEG
jgi:hypothetical protein